MAITDPKEYQTKINKLIDGSNNITNSTVGAIYDENNGNYERTNMIIDALENKVITDNSKKERTKTVIKILTKLNTTPFIDPGLGRFVDIFFPDITMPSSEDSAQKTYNKTTEFKLNMYQNPHFDSTKDISNSYGQSFLTRSEKFDNPFDQVFDDIFGIELFMQTLMNTGSNIEKLEETAKPKYSEVYTITEKKDKSMFYEK
jgi:hypothetical protein